ncbi:peptidoglycan bridge formation glycyltransferase FemA/FemB family protein [Carnobacteriaceae bacterium zg-84]|uniref:peptidoglycan bridge formation glycyltransferase FemA/FemB family protein n=1 Tax=Granulicatella sp. zg-84 TaxID=2678503 RepID=UPI0013C0C82B|nr:peptidoglycan bridge formation glycyltransferase FemA/FemB family protein [Granulicatella sp. zg-84]NEW66553.1 peptidoglycan bridge formation glycyltransferase FemA/FemB family protein [Granulicatella sp. zg-84]QMI85798.1 peptidoglycan bridge formation glycyltransferase FemA/FemB family protein [Carnobacteriaceae bacterium zg-84]
MQFLELDIDTLKAYQIKNTSRYFFSQSYDYARMAEKNKLKHRILAVIENDTLLAYGIFLYFRHKKIFYRVTAQYGPIMDYTDKELVTFYFKQIKQYFMKQWRVVSVRVNPFLSQRFYEDVTYMGDNQVATDVDAILSDLQFKALNMDMFDDLTLPTQCVYTKSLGDINGKDLLKQFPQKTRYTINKTMKEGVLVREIDIFDTHDAHIFNTINKETELRNGVKTRDIAYFQTMKSVLGKHVHFMVTYIDCPVYLENIEQTIDQLEREQLDLSEKLALGKVNVKKTENKLKELKENTVVWQTKREKTLELQAQEGDMIYLSCASFIESGQDFIYFSSGSMDKFSRFEGPSAMIYTMMLYAIENKFMYFNFYGTSKQFLEMDAADYGVLQFKRSFEGNIEYFMDNYELKRF